MDGSLYKPVREINRNSKLGGWIFNIRQHNWKLCVEGPQNERDHGEENVGNPWHGIKKASRAGEHPADINEGDIIFARRALRTEGGKHGPKNQGLLGIWRFHDYSRVSPDMSIPWDNGPQDYRFVLYCREDPTVGRNFNRPISENFNSETIPFDQTELNNSISRLTSFEKAPYVNHLLEQDPQNEAMKNVLKQLASRWAR